MLFQARICSFDKKSQCHLFSLSTGRAPEGESLLNYTQQRLPSQNAPVSFACLRLCLSLLLWDVEEKKQESLMQCQLFKH